MLTSSRLDSSGSSFAPTAAEPISTNGSAPKPGGLPSRIRPTSRPSQGNTLSEISPSISKLRPVSSSTALEMSSR